MQNVTILQIRTGYIFKSGSLGTFGIVTNQRTDTFSFSIDGYRKEQLVVNADQYLNVRLKALPASATNIRRDRLVSLTKDLEFDEQKTWFSGEETYASIIENHFIEAKKFPSTGMTLNVDQASYSNIRRFITFNSLVPPDAVRIEEMLNYFNLSYNEPAGHDLFNAKTTLSSCPWDADNELYYINVSARRLNLDTLPASQLVFLIDVSGSMDMPNRLPLLKSAFRLLVNNLRPKDSVAIVVYGGTVGTMLNTTSGGDKQKILDAIDSLTPGGSTPGESGIKLAYSIARNHFIRNGNNRVILATDGDFNVGLKTENELDELISQQRQSGIYLTCLGVGMGNYKDSKIQTLSKKGNGNFAYLDNYQEAEKVLLTEFTQTLYGVADNVSMNVRFNPEYVKEYRLIGFDNRVGALKDTISAIEGGEIGSGHSMMALFEIKPTELNAETLNDNATNAKFADVSLLYRYPQDTVDKHFTYASQFEYKPFEELDKSFRFSAAVAMFGSLLRSSPYVHNIGWNDVIALAEQSTGKTDILQQEFIGLVQQAKILYSKNKKKRKAE